MNKINCAGGQAPARGADNTFQFFFGGGWQWNSLVEPRSTKMNKRPKKKLLNCSRAPENPFNDVTRGAKYNSAVIDENGVYIQQPNPIVVVWQTKLSDKKSIRKFSRCHSTLPYQLESEIHNRIRQGCQIFLGSNIPKWGENTKWPQTIPNGRKSNPGTRQGN
jgi:hypothetical protein